MKINFKNKTVLITGGTRGIGKTLVDSFLKLNAKVIFTGTKESFHFKKNNYHNKKIYKKLNFLNLEDINNFNDFLKNNNYKIDILVNNAGINLVKKFNDYSNDDIENIINVNLKNQIIFSRVISNQMIKNNKKYKKIINISSIWSIKSKKKRSIYSISKNGMNGFTKSLALDLADYNILVNSISPGFTKTSLTLKTNSKAEIKKIIDSIPLKKMANTKDISDLILFLTSDYNQYITGQNITIDGGFTIS